MMTYPSSTTNRNTAAWILLTTAVLSLILSASSGCRRAGRSADTDGPSAPLAKRIADIEAKRYTTYRNRPHMVLVREVQELFEIKEAYPWLIEAMDSDDELVARTVQYEFTSSGTPGAITAQGLRQWYATQPPEQWVYRGGLWEPAPGPVGRTFDLTPTPDELQHLEESVLNDGHQPWRLNPLFVGQVELGTVLAEHYPDEAPDRPMIQAADGDPRWRLVRHLSTATVTYSEGELTAAITLANSRPDTGDGIWFARTIVIREE